MVVVLTYPLGQFCPRNSVSMFFFFESPPFFFNSYQVWREPLRSRRDSALEEANTILPRLAAAALLIKQIGPEVKKRSGERMPRAEDKAARGLHCSALNKSRISNVKYLGQDGLAQ